MPRTATVGSIVLSEDRTQVSRWTLTASSKGCASTRQDGTVNLSMGAAPDGKAELPGRTCWNVPRQIAVFLEERVCPVIESLNLRNLCTHGGRGDKILPTSTPPTMRPMITSTMLISLSLKHHWVRIALWILTRYLELLSRKSND
jgi:hypothetical protein